MKHTHSHFHVYFPSGSTSGGSTAGSSADTEGVIGPTLGVNAWFDGEVRVMVELEVASFSSLLIFVLDSDLSLLR